MSFTDIPSDILFLILSKCSVLDILSLSSTCKQLQQTTDEYQVWLDQARLLETPIPLGATPSKEELKDQVISRTRVDVCWTKSRPGELSPHLLEAGTEIAGAHFIPGGEFVVILYRNGSISLSKIERSAVAGNLKVQEVVRYENTAARDNPGGSWSRLLTETSYGCPVLIWVGRLHWGYPLVFLIDPVSQVIERKYHIHTDISINGVISLEKTLAIKDRIFFILKKGQMEIRVTVIAEPGPEAVTRSFCLVSPVVDEVYETFAVSENCLVISDSLGIWVYHIPELRTIGEDLRLLPAWGRTLHGSSYRVGTLYKMASPYPAIWLLGEEATHTLEFDVDESGCYPVIVNHQIIWGRPDFKVGDNIELRGRKGMGVETRRRDEIVFNTGILGESDTRRLRAPIPGLNTGHRSKQDKAWHTDLDEVTGRIMVLVGPVPGRRQDDTPRVRRLYITEVPT